MRRVSDSVFNEGFFQFYFISMTFWIWFHLFAFFRYCGVSKPTWMELRNFVYFFNQQLIDSEASIFTSAAMNDDLRGFKGFVIKFLLEMAKVSGIFLSLWWEIYSLLLCLSFCLRSLLCFWFWIQNKMLLMFLQQVSPEKLLLHIPSKIIIKCCEKQKPYGLYLQKQYSKAKHCIIECLKAFAKQPLQCCIITHGRLRFFVVIFR